MIIMGDFNQDGREDFKELNWQTDDFDGPTQVRGNKIDMIVSEKHIMGNTIPIRELKLSDHICLSTEVTINVKKLNKRILKISRKKVMEENHKMRNLEEAFEKNRNDLIVTLRNWEVETDHFWSEYLEGYDRNKLMQ